VVSFIEGVRRGLSFSEGIALQPQASLPLPHDLTFRDYQCPVWDYFTQDKPGLRGMTVWPRRNGKDLVALNILVAKAMQRVGLYLYLGPLQTQVRQIVWMGGTNEGRKFLSYIPQQLIKAKRNSQMEIDLVNGSMIKLVGSDQYDSLMGLNAIGAVFTEFSLQRPEAWEYIRPMMAGNGGWALFNGTPRALNHMHAMAMMAERNPKWFYQYLTRDDTGYPDLQTVKEEREAGMKESLIEQEYYCSWTSSSESTFIPLDYVAKALENPLEVEDYNFEPNILGCDVAYSAKGDKASIAHRQGRKLHFVRWYRGMDNMAFASEIARYIDLLKPEAVCIDAGRGEGVISRLEQLGYASVIYPVHFGGKVYQEGIADKKALMWSRMLEWYMAANGPDIAGLDDHPHANELVEEELIKETTTPNMILDEKNRVKVEPKTSLKSRGVNSPDLAEAVGLTFAEDVATGVEVPASLAQYGVTAEILAQMITYQQPYDPLNYMDRLTARV